MATLTPSCIVCAKLRPSADSLPWAADDAEVLVDVEALSGTVELDVAAGSGVPLVEPLQPATRAVEASISTAARKGRAVRKIFNNCSRQ
ncbi:MAG: hypothetical protein QM662_16630 [Gordonia sp. (in: high G+C Gram-positive bacteria)]